MVTPQRNPFTKRHLNLDEQGRLFREDPKLFAELQAAAPGIDAEHERQKRTRSLYEFNEMDTAGKLAFIKDGGVIA